tara:strand:+ start:13019 stop:13204 length:186 start_codon:yes stop_codon:yes gene_type:complete
MAGKYWIGNEPSSSVTSAQAKKIAADPAAAIADVDTANAANNKAAVNLILAALRAHGIVTE